MKNYITISLSILLFWCIGTVLLSQIWHQFINNTPINSINTWVTINARPQITDIYQYSMMDEIWSNPESTRMIRESYQEVGYRIHKNPSRNEVLVYLPTFFSLSTQEQDKFSQELRALQDYELSINIFTYSNFDIDSIQRFYNSLQPGFSSITWRFYDIPNNYYEFFRQFWVNLANKDVIVEFYGKIFPDGFMMSSLIDNMRDMFTRVLNQWEILNSLSFSAEEMWDVFFMLPMTQSGSMTIQHLPTKSLYSDRIIIDSRAGGPWESLSWKDKIQKFFQESTIEYILLNWIGEKNGNKIILYGF